MMRRWFWAAGTHVTADVVECPARPRTSPISSQNGAVADPDSRQVFMLTRSAQARPRRGFDRPPRTTLEPPGLSSSGRGGNDRGTPFGARLL